ncbi:MAG: EAL domain-containing protein [Gammaproteobacteria bacterium]|nr:EAL domain-containing protein [Gammaproteobacteria bacterium]
MSDTTSPGTLVLIVEDDVVSRIAVQDYLEEAGFRTACAEDGDGGLAAFQALRPDLVLLDVSMPGRNGFDVCRDIRAHPGGQHVPIVMMTGHDDLESVDRAYDSGATDFVAKPMNFGLLIHRLRYVLRAKQMADQLRRSEASLAQAQRIARLGSWDLEIESGRFQCTDELQRLFFADDGGAAAPDRPSALDEVLAQVCEEDRPGVIARYHEALAAGEDYDIDFRLRADDGATVHVHQETEFQHGDDGRPLLAFGTFQDVTEARLSEARIRELAFFDPVTGLPNRVFFMERLSEVLAMARRNQRCMALMFVDLDQFKRVNDSWGHHAGDELLRQVSQRLSESLRRCDLLMHNSGADERPLARLGGDEFVVLLSEIRRADDAAIVARRLLQELKRPFDIGATEVYVSGSIGISTYPDDGLDEETLLRHADIAMYRVKEEGRNGFRFFEADMNSRAIARLNMETSLWRALERDEFRLHYQPKIDATTGAVTGAEALVRWYHPDIGLISPGEFIPVAEETGLVAPLGTWVIQQACRQAAAWQQACRRSIKISVNLSAAQFAQDGLIDTIEAAVRTAGITPGQLQVELTESMLMEDVERHIRALDALRALGIEVAIDDFGTGYSSLAYLRRLPIDCVKIDRDFVREIARDRRDAAIVRGAIALAHSLDLTVVAEGVEDAGQLDMLCRFGCDEIQGYHFSPALQPDEFIAWWEDYEARLALDRRASA